MKFLICGDWSWPQYEQAFAAALIELKHRVAPFNFSTYFRGRLGKSLRAIPLPGRQFFQLNRDLLAAVEDERPDVMLAWRCTHVFPHTIKRIGDMGVRTVSYNNDDPFGPWNYKQAPWHHRLLWHWYLRALPRYRFNFFYRRINVMEANEAGASHADVMMPYFVPNRDRPISLSKEEQARFGCDAVFVGHYEPDGREKYLHALVDSGLSVRLFGTDWPRRVLGDYFDYFTPIVRLEGDEYVKALCGATACLAFLSKLNRDTYTRRCFEIPACGRVLLAERTDDLLNLFKEDEEACFFSTSEELVAKVLWLKKNPNVVTRISLAGQRRVWQDGHDVTSRVRQFLRTIGADSRWRPEG